MEKNELNVVNAPNTLKRRLSSPTGGLESDIDGGAPSLAKQRLTKYAADYNARTNLFRLEDFSDEVLYEIFKYLDSWTLLALMNCSSRFETLLFDRRFWVNIDLGQGPLPLGILEEILYRTNEKTHTVKMCGPSPAQHVDGEFRQFSRTLAKTLPFLCNKLRILELERVTIDFHFIRITDFPGTLKRFMVKHCSVKIPEDIKSIFQGIDSHMQDLEELIIEDNEWFEPYYIMVFSKLPSLRRLSLKGCPNLSKFVPYGSMAARFGFAKLEHLDLRFTPINNSDLQCFSACQTLREMLIECPPDFQERLEAENSVNGNDSNTTNGNTENSPNTATDDRPSTSNGQSSMEDFMKSLMSSAKPLWLRRRRRGGSPSSSSSSSCSSSPASSSSSISSSSSSSSLSSTSTTSSSSSSSSSSSIPNVGSVLPTTSVGNVLRPESSASRRATFPFSFMSNFGHSLNQDSSSFATANNSNNNNAPSANRMSIRLIPQFSLAPLRRVHTVDPPEPDAARRSGRIIFQDPHADAEANRDSDLNGNNLQSGNNANHSDEPSTSSSTKSNSSVPLQPGSKVKLPRNDANDDDDSGVDYDAPSTSSARIIVQASASSSSHFARVAPSGLLPTFGSPFVRMVTLRGARSESGNYAILKTSADEFLSLRPNTSALASEKKKTDDSEQNRSRSASPAGRMPNSIRPRAPIIGEKAINRSRLAVDDALKSLRSRSPADGEKSSSRSTSPTANNQKSPRSQSPDDYGFETSPTQSSVGLSSPTTSGSRSPRTMTPDGQRPPKIVPATAAAAAAAAAAIDGGGRSRSRSPAADYQRSPRSRSPSDDGRSSPGPRSPLILRPNFDMRRGNLPAYSRFLPRPDQVIYMDLNNRRRPVVVHGPRRLLPGGNVNNNLDQVIAHPMFWDMFDPVNRHIAFRYGLQNQSPGQNAALQSYYISDRGICCFGRTANPVEAGVIWIRNVNRANHNHLERLIVRNYRHVTDISLRHLVQCSPNLIYLDLTGTSVTRAGIRQFLASKPDCEVIAEHIQDLNDDSVQATASDDDDDAPSEEQGPQNDNPPDENGPDNNDPVDDAPEPNGLQ